MLNLQSPPPRARGRECHHQLLASVLSIAMTAPFSNVSSILNHASVKPSSKRYLCWKAVWSDWMEQSDLKSSRWSRAGTPRAVAAPINNDARLSIQCLCRTSAETTEACKFYRIDVLSTARVPDVSKNNDQGNVGREADGLLVHRIVDKTHSSSPGERELVGLDSLVHGVHRANSTASHWLAPRTTSAKKGQKVKENPARCEGVRAGGTRRRGKKPLVC